MALKVNAEGGRWGTRFNKNTFILNTRDWVVKYSFE
jgi:hypothetical protein